MYKNKRQTPLLSIVKGKAHATQDHHEDPIPERYTDGPQQGGQKKNGNEAEDMARDPISDFSSTDDDDKENSDFYKPPPRQIGSAPKTVRAPRKANSINLHGTREDASSSSRPQAREKASGRHADLEQGDQAESSTIFSSQGSNKRSRPGYGRGSKKLKTSTVDSKAPEAPKAAAGFKHPTAIDKLAAPRAQFKTFAGLAKPSIASGEEHSVPQSSQTSSIQFRRPDLETPPSTDTSTAFKPARTTATIASSPLTELSSSDDDDAKYTKPKTVDQDKAEKSCPLCGEEVDVTFKRDFLIEKCKGKRMNVRLQELFCKAHKERTAKKQWQDREYPEIDWIALPRRLKRHGRRIQDVLDGKVHSVYRDELEERLRSGKTKSAMQVWVNETDTLVRVGYYGSRGEKAMTDYIVKAFGEDLRQRAGTDHVINAMGVTGGVSGYLQSVLVPEMALALVMEDADCDAEEARRIIKESSDIGDALNEVEQEKVPRSTAMMNLIDSDDEDEEDYHDDSLLLND